jgi:hypothetical protein
VAGYIGTRKHVLVSALMAGSKVQSEIRGRHKGTDLLRDPRRDEEPAKHQRLKRHLQTLTQTTHPCAFAYSYARIRRLVGFVPGLYRLWVAGNPATGFSDPTRYKYNDAPVCRRRLRRRYGGCAWETFGSAGSYTSRFANPRTAATLTCLATGVGGSTRYKNGASP